MEQKNKRIILIALISIVVITIATSTAYLMATILPNINNPENLNVNTDKLVLVYTDCAENETGDCENTKKN